MASWDRVQNSRRGMSGQQTSSHERSTSPSARSVCSVDRGLACGSSWDGAQFNRAGMVGQNNAGRERSRSPSARSVDRGVARSRSFDNPRMMRQESRGSFDGSSHHHHRTGGSFGVQRGL